MPNTKGFVKRLLAIYKPFKWAVVMAFVFVIVQQVFALASPYLYGLAINALVKQNFSLILRLALFVLLIETVSTIIGAFRERFEVNHLDYSVAKAITSETLEKLFSFSIGQHHSQNSAIKQSIINKGESALRQFAYSLLYNIMPIFFQVILIIGALMYLNWVLGLIVFVGVTTFVSITLVSNAKIRPQLKKMEDMQNDDSKRHTEIIRNIEAVKVNAQESKIKRDYDRELDKSISFGRRFWLKYVVSMYSRSIVIDLTTFLVMIVGAYMVIRGYYSIGYLFIFLSWTSNALGRVNNLGNLQRQMMSQYASIREFFAMMDIEPDIKITEDPISPKTFRGEIVFNDVSFEYPARQSSDNNNGKPPEPIKTSRRRTLSGISFKINPGEKVAFVGESGAGKSTIVNLLIRAYDPQKGRILIDGIDLKELDLKKYRENLGLVEQHVTLFDNTLGYNITFGLDGKKELVSEERMHEVARMACIDKFYHRLEHGFDTVIGEKGIKLSGGERQRVGIARALIKEPQILVFDEATSNLDTENEMLIRKAIEKASVGRTTIIIAHRLSTIRSVDRIFVIDNGKLVAEGKHSELAKTCPRYQALIKNQITTI
ncbi:MAG: ABC transporter ATP-binding protein [Minisyncoccia bacterium]|jgi:ABC-type multidrug transport system fused ATPase/permease subunit